MMINGWSLRQRLLGLVLGTGLLVLGVCVVLLVSTTSELVRNQAEANLSNRTHALANTLNVRLQAIDTTLRTLSAGVGSGTDGADLHLWRTVSQAFVRSDYADISAVGLVTPFRDGYSAVVFNQPHAPAVTAPMKMLIYETGPPIPWFDPARWSDDVQWYDQRRSDFSNHAPQLGYTATLNVHDDNRRPAGLVWVTFPAAIIDEHLREQTALQGQTHDCYTLLVDANGSLLAAFDHSGDPLRVSTAIDTALGRLIRAAQDTDDLSASVYDPIYDVDAALAIPSDRLVNGWQIINVMPQRVVPNVLVSNLVPFVTLTIGGLLLLSFVVYWLLTRELVEPLDGLTRAAQEIGAGDPRYTIDYRERGDEIGKLAGAMEAMRVNINHSYERLAQWNKALGKSVDERTQELQLARTEAQKRAETLQMVYDASLAVVTEYSLPVVLKKLVERLVILFNASYWSVWLLNDTEDGFELVETTPETRHNLHQIIVADAELPGHARRHREPIILDDYATWSHRLDWIAPNMGRALCVPLIYSRQFGGALVIGRRADKPIFTGEDALLLTLLASLVSPVVRNAKLFDQHEDAVKEAERANQVKNSFLASVTHELRTPLNLVINNLDFMRIGQFGLVTSEQRSRLDQSVRSAEHLLYLINDLLDISKIEAGEMQLNIAPADLKPVLEDTLDSALALIPEDKPVALVPTFPDDLPQVPMDARRVRQILTNLLSNAIKFTEQGVITFAVEQRQHTIVFTITDTGVGIPREKLATIFSAFEREPSASDGIEGTGLGLAITRHLVEAHGGRLHVDSVVGKGSTFIFDLPLDPPSQPSDHRKITAVFTRLERTKSGSQVG